MGTEGVEATAGALTVPSTLTASVPAWNRASGQAVVDETEEKANQRLQLIVALLNDGEPPIVQVSTLPPGQGQVWG